MANQGEISEKVLKYEKFVNEVLKEDLRKVLEQRDKVHEQIAEYFQLKNSIHLLKDNKPEGPLHTKVDLGCNFYCQARVGDISHIFVLVGLGFYVELTLDEAVRVIDRKCQQLSTVADSLTKDANSIKAHIKFVIEGLREVQGISDEPVENKIKVNL